tara:strand:- start:3361 stop:3480 length:120 start_codon:yes stop_codon:yes gene_type:complete
MILHTGGLESGLSSIKSSPKDVALSKASLINTIPNCLPS